MSYVTLILAYLEFHVNIPGLSAARLQAAHFRLVKLQSGT